MSTNRVHNFNAGPSALPLPILEEMREGFMGFGGMSILEISHRSKDYEKINDETIALFRELLGIPNNYQVAFLQGGASLQFAMVPMNLLEKTADYSLTGHWAERALKEAKVIGNTNVVFTSKEQNFTRCPRKEEVKATPGASYLHITTNNTIYGTQYFEMPDTGAVPLIADMSSDILSRAIDVSKFGLIYAGAQKNLGPAGVTVVIIRDDLVKREARPLPTILKYATHVEAKSLYNTPPVFAVYLMGLMLKWVKREGGLKEIQRRNEEKASILYSAIDGSQIYKGTASKESRSKMNITFTLPSEELTEKFVADAKKQGIVGIKGHRNVGGIRASCYNAVTVEDVKALTTFMADFGRNV
jgi:phosphoserine aminotransferase